MSTQPRDNEFTIKIANVNGTGSASANALLMKTFFRMGIPVVGKNYFPSNIQGLPTWYEIRVSGDGYLARSGRVDVVVAMNAETYHKDLLEVAPGGYTPRHSHPYEHEVFVLEGEGVVLEGDTEHALKAGDVVFVQPNDIHQFRNVGDKPMKFLCMVPNSATSQQMTVAPECGIE